MPKAQFDNLASSFLAGARSEQFAGLLKSATGDAHAEYNLKKKKKADNKKKAGSTTKTGSPA